MDQLNRNVANENNSNFILREIVQAARIIDCEEPDHKATVMKTVEYRGRHYKVRGYRTHLDAQRRLAFLDLGKGLIAPALGRFERFLIFEYIDGETLSGSKGCKAVIQFLVNLAAINANSMEELGREQFESWCSKIEECRLFTKRTLKSMRQYYARSVAHCQKWGLEYYDALPRNFVWDGSGICLAIDEKHLLAGPRGVSLIKLRWQLSQEEFDALATGYFSQTNAFKQHDEAHWTFLEFYYLVYSLAFNADQRTLSTNLASAAFHQRRRKLIDLMEISSLGRIRETLGWLVLHAFLKGKRSAVVAFKQCGVRVFPNAVKRIRQMQRL